LRENSDLRDKLEQALREKLGLAKAPEAESAAAAERSAKAKSR